MDTRTDQRRDRRTTAAVDVVLETNNLNYFAQTANVGAGGLYLRAKKTFRPGTRIRMLFGPPYLSRIDAYGEVKWLKEGEGYGVEFLELDPHDRRALGGLLDPLPASKLES